MLRREFLGLLALGCGDDMATYPSSPNKFPATPNKYPGTPSKYPTSPNAFPSGGTAVPSTPLQIFGTRLAHWWDPDDASNTVSGGKLSNVVNKGGDLANFSGDMAQATGANQPLQDYLRGDHKAAIYDIAQAQRMSATLVGSLSAPYTYIRIKQQWGVGTVDDCDGASTGGLVQTTGATFPKTMLLNAGTSLSVSSVVNEDELAVWGCVFGTAGVGELRKNGVSVGSGTTNVGALATSIFWGSSSTATAFDGSASGDFMVVKGTLSAQDWTDVQTYAAWKYGIGNGTQFVAVGDSNTGPCTGATSTRTGWRGLMWNDYSRARKSGKWLVANGHVRPFAFADDRHAGVSGQTVAGAATLIAALFGVGKLYNDPIVLYMIGTNNMATYAAGVTAPANADNVRQIDSLINAATGVRPQIVVCNIIDCDPAKTTQHTNTPLYNAELTGPGGQWDILAGEGLHLTRVDAFAAVGAYQAANYYQVDGLGVHLTDAGHALLAPAIRAGLYAAAANI